MQHPWVWGIWWVLGGLGPGREERTSGGLLRLQWSCTVAGWPGDVSARGWGLRGWSSLFSDLGSTGRTSGETEVNVSIINLEGLPLARGATCAVVCRAGGQPAATPLHLHLASWEAAWPAVPHPMALPPSRMSKGPSLMFPLQLSCSHNKTQPPTRCGHCSCRVRVVCWMSPVCRPLVLSPFL